MGQEQLHDPMLWEYLSSRCLEHHAVTAEIIAEAARAGVEIAEAIYIRMGTSLGRGLAMIANTHNPQIIVLAGSVMRSAELFLEVAVAEMDRLALRGNADIQILISELGDDNSLIGAAKLAELQSGIQ
jgi:predicted NBD/HSP70 family sugar kinase